MEAGKAQNQEAAAAPQHAAVYVEQVITSMKGKLGALDGERPRRPTICRALPAVREADAASYEPMTISIGPFHKDKPEVRGTVELKWRFLHDLLGRCPGTNLGEPTRVIAEQVKDIRGQYSEEFPGIADGDFVQMLVVDGCFILEFMCKVQFEEMSKVLSPGGAWLLPHAVNDLFLLENQIPFSVLETLYEALTPPPSEFTLPELLFHCFVARHPNSTGRAAPPANTSDHHLYHLLHFHHLCNVLQCRNKDDKKREIDPPSLSHTFVYCMVPRRASVRVPLSLVPWLVHRLRLPEFFGFLGRVGLRLRDLVMQIICFPFLLIMCCTSRGGGLTNDVTKPSLFPSQSSPLMSSTIPSATKLKDAGVRFRRRQFPTEESCHFLKVGFSPEGVFEIPFLFLHGGSNNEFRNLIAFEQCCGDLPDVGGHSYGCYCLLMAHLVGTEEDVGVLQEHGIISIVGNPAQVATFFAKVCQGAHIDLPSSCFAQLLKDVNRYCDSDLHRWRARLMRDYFGNPWTTISVVAAGVLLALTVVQTFYTVYVYYHPRN